MIRFAKNLKFFKQTNPAKNQKLCKLGYYKSFELLIRNLRKSVQFETNLVQLKIQASYASLDTHKTIQFFFELFNGTIRWYQLFAKICILKFFEQSIISDKVFFEANYIRFETLK